MFAPFSHSFPNLLLLASNRQGCWTRWTLELAIMAGSTLQTCQKTEEGHHSNKMQCFFPGALLLQQLATAGRTSSRAKRHLQGKTDRGYRVHQQPGATLRQKPSKDGACGQVYSTSSDYCMLIFHFVHSLNTSSFKMVTDYMRRGRKDIFFK